MNKRINIAAPIIGREETSAVQQVLQSNSLAQGPKVAELESSFAAYCGAKYAVAFNSGTAALHAALHAAGLEPGDSVITTPFSFIATINPILMLGAKVKLVDIEPASFNVDAQAIEPAVDSSTKVILPVDLYGQPADYDSLHQTAQKHGLKIVEDACQAVGAAYKGTRAGALGNVGCFSLYATKNITSAEGGIFTTNDAAIMEDGKSFRQHGMSSSYEYGQLGYNYRMTDILAAIAVEQLKKADRFNTIRQQNAAALSAGLQNIPGLVLPQVAPHRTHVWHQYTVRVTKNFPLSRQQLMAELDKKGIGAGIYYPKPLHFYQHIQSLGFKKGQFPVAEQAAEEVLSLPVHPKVSATDIEHISKTIREIANV